MSMELRPWGLNQQPSFGIKTVLLGHTLCLILDFSLAVGPLYIDQTVPKMQDVEKEMSAEFNGWVNSGGSWKPTDCQARVKVKC